MKKNRFIIFMVLLNLICFFISIPFVLALHHDFIQGESPYNWYNSCENLFEWEIDSTISASYEYTYFKEGEYAIVLDWYPDRGMGYSGVARLQIPHIWEHGRLAKEKYLGFYMSFLRYDLGNAVNSTQTQFRIRHSNNHVHGFKTWCISTEPITRGWQHICSGESTGTQYQWNYQWYWWEFNGMENQTETGLFTVKNPDDGHSFTNVQGKGNYSYFEIELFDYAYGQRVSIVIDYIRISDVNWEYPPTLPPPIEEELKPPPIEDYIPIGMGLTGLGLIVFMPFLLVVMFRRRKWHWIIRLFVMIPIGIALIIGWLWG